MLSFWRSFSDISCPYCNLLFSSAYLESKFAQNILVFSNKEAKRPTWGGGLSTDLSKINFLENGGAQRVCRHLITKTWSLLDVLSFFSQIFLSFLHCFQMYASLIAAFCCCLISTSLAFSYRISLLEMIGHRSGALIQVPFCGSVFQHSLWCDLGGFLNQ